MIINCKCDTCGSKLIRKAIFKNYFCSKYCKGLWQIEQRENLGFTKEWLIEEYINKKRSGDDIARQIGRDAKSVWRWLKDYGIQKRPRGTDYGQCFKKGCKTPFEGKKHTQETKDKIRKRRLEDGHVPYLKDGIHWLKHKDAKPATWRGGITPERQSLYSSQEWIECVKAIWKRDNATCQRCNKHHNTEENRGNFHIHHIVNFSNKELRTTISNLILVCRPCHLWIHSKKNINKEFIKDEGI